MKDDQLPKTERIPKDAVSALCQTKKKPWWFPKLTDHAWCDERRKDYPADAYLTDEALREKYADGWKYQTLWDHLGDAREEYEQLADAYLALLS